LKIKTICFIILLLYCFGIYGQEDKNYIVPEFLIGSIVPNYLNSPAFGAKTGLSVTYYKSANRETLTNQYYNHPLFGLQAGFYTLGNSDVYGNEINLMPVLGMRMKKGMFQWGIGTSYFTKTYRQNERNQSIGSHFNWAFQWMYYRSFDISEKRSLRLGIGYRHSSNGHVQLPNYGLNSAVFSVTFTPKALKSSMPDKEEVSKSRSFFLKI
jgi:hypothetical protein